MNLTKELYGINKNTKDLLNWMAIESNILLEVETYQNFASGSEIRYKLVSERFATENLFRDLGEITRQSIIKLINYLLKIINNIFNFLKNLNIKNKINNLKNIFSQGIDITNPKHISFIRSFSLYSQLLLFANKIENVKDLKELTEIKFKTNINVNDIGNSINDILNKGNFYILNLNGFNNLINEIKEVVNNDMYLPKEEREYITKGTTIIDNINNEINNNVHDILSNKNYQNDLSNNYILNNDKIYKSEIIVYYETIFTKEKDILKNILINMNDLINMMSKKIKTLNSDDQNEKELISTYNAYINFIKVLLKIFLDINSLGLYSLESLNKITGK